jgi:hypothetical protein
MVPLDGYAASPYVTGSYRAWVLPTDPPADDSVPRCSSRGCRAAATTDLRWRNPRLHDASRVKHWLACDEHADFLADFLARRSFLLERAPLEPGA